MKFYKLRHKPTGLFYKPSKHGSKSNLSKTGKVYQGIKPSLSYVKDGYRIVIKGENRYQDKVIHERYKAEEWEIVEFVTNET